MDENIYKAHKIGKNKYSAKRPKRRLSLNVFRSLNIVHYKGRWVVALTQDDWSDRHFRSCDTINRTEALRIISFLSDYVNLVKPTEATKIFAGIKVSNNRALRLSSELAGIAITEEQK